MHAPNEGTDSAILFQTKIRIQETVREWIGLARKERLDAQKIKPLETEAEN